jgi:hypothetical protein
MPHPESSWRAEIEAHVPQGRDLAELRLRLPELSDWRADLISEGRETKEDLESWEAYIQENRIAVLIEHGTEDGTLDDEEAIASRLEGCPPELKEACMVFVQQAPEHIRDYLVHATYCLVQIVRERRTGSAEWRTEAASGSPEVLSELMFKWGPRFRRHRWSW